MIDRGRIGARAVASAMVAAFACASACGGGALDRAAVPTTAPAATTAPTTASSPPPSSPTSSVAPGAPAGGYVSAITASVVDGRALDTVEARLLARVRAAGLPGASLLVVQHGTLVEQEAWLDYTLDTRVAIASGSKWLTAATVMTLVDDGSVALDEPIATYVPELAGRESGRLTMRQLLSFTSGLAPDDGVPCVTDAGSTLQMCAGVFLARRLVHAPGVRFVYGSQHMIVAAAVAERITKVPFATLFQQRVAAPLAMSRSVFFQSGDATVQPVTNPNPAGTAASTLGDYARFLEMLVHRGLAPDGRRILSERSVAEMLREQTADAPIAFAAAFRVADKSPYGLGAWIDWAYPDRSPMVMSSDGKFGFRPWIDTKNDLFGVYLVEDRGSGFVEGDPDTATGTGSKVHTSGNFVFEWTASALGGSLPAVKYPGGTAR